MLNSRITITGVKQPVSGAILVHQCKHCKKTEFFWTPFLMKPLDGDIWLVTDYCENCWWRDYTHPVTWPHTSIRMPFEL